MEESGRESQPRCPCGFWGSTKTLGLCSVCYRRAIVNQPQGNTNSSDAGRAGVGVCPNQSPNSSQVKKMDSKHFPSRSTADNLPSSHSSPPGERAALSAAQPPAVEATAPSPGGGATPPSLMPAAAAASAGNDVAAQLEPASMTLQSCESLQSGSELDLCSSVNGDTSLSSLCFTESNTALTSSTPTSNASASSSSSSMPLAQSEGDEDFCMLSPSVIANQISGGTLQKDTGCSVHHSSNSAKTLNAYGDAISAMSSTISSSNKNSTVKDTENRAKVVDNCPSDMNSPASSADTLTNASRGQDQVSVGDDISSNLARGVKRSRDEMEASNEEETAPSPQKNKSRCFICSCKLELAQRTIGRCRCDRVFCGRHRLPELHDCEFNHKEDGRREAREKMIKPTRHLGPSYRRDDRT